MSIFSDVGKRIRLVRTSKKMTQEKLADLIDMDVRSVIAIESGARNPTLRTLHKICNALRVKSGELLTF